MADDRAPMTPPALPQGLLDRLLDEAEAAAPPAAEPPPTPPPPVGQSSGETPPPPAGNPLGLLLQNPALLSALPSLMENLSPLLGSLGGGTGSAPHATRPHSIDRHTALLCALKPYLSPHRRETAETVLRLCKVWDALERSGISLSGLLGSVGGGTASSEGRDDRVQ
jgi:hypothetical protein